MATTLINRTVSTGGSRDKGTFSCWCKKAGFGGTLGLFAHLKDGSNRFLISFETDETLKIGNRVGGSYDLSYVTARKFTDSTAWYHIVVAVDTTAGSGDRVKLWVNGVRETAWSSSTQPGSGDLMQFNKAESTNYKAYVGGANHFDGIITHAHWIDGTAYQASDFGEFDATSGIWTIKIEPSVTYGENGFFILKNSNSLTDQSGEGNNFTLESGTLTTTKDNPHNNFATLGGKMYALHSDLTPTNGNTGLSSSNAQWLGCGSTQAVFTGKWYVEAKYITGYNFKLGVVANGGVGMNTSGHINWATANSSYPGHSSMGYEYQYNNSGTGYKVNSNSSPSWAGGSFSTATSIIMMAFDATNGKIWWGRDGTWFNSSGTANPATGTDPAFTGIDTDKAPFLFGIAVEGSGGTNFINFGNGYFGTTDVTSAVADGAGEGRFEYTPPTGFYAVCTNNIKTYG